MQNRGQQWSLAHIIEWPRHLHRLAMQETCSGQRPLSEHLTSSFEEVSSFSMPQRRNPAAERDLQHTRILVSLLVSSLVIILFEAVTIALDFVAKVLSLADALPNPLGEVLGRILHGLDGVVPSALDLVFGPVPTALYAVLSPVEVVLNSVRHRLDGPDGLAGPARRVLGEVLDVLHAVVPLTLEVSLLAAEILGWREVSQSRSSTRSGARHGSLAMLQTTLLTGFLEDGPLPAPLARRLIDEDPPPGIAVPAGHPGRLHVRRVHGLLVATLVVADNLG